MKKNYEQPALDLIALQDAPLLASNNVFEDGDNYGNEDDIFKA